MNWKRGLFRSWLLIALLWWCGWTAYTLVERNTIDQYTVFNPRLPGEGVITVQYPWQLSWTGEAQQQCVQDRTTVLGTYVPQLDIQGFPCFYHKSLSDLSIWWLIVFPPLALFGFGLLGLWSIKGFRK